MRRRARDPQNGGEGGGDDAGDDTTVRFELKGGVARFARHAFDALPDSMPGRLLRSPEFSAGRRTFSFREECSYETFNDVLACALSGETVNCNCGKDDYRDKRPFFRELAFLGVDVAPDRDLAAPLREELVAAADLICGQLVKIDLSDVALGASPFVALGMPDFSAAHASAAKAILAHLPVYEAAERAAPGFVDDLQTLDFRFGRLLAPTTPSQPSESSQSGP